MISDTSQGIVALFKAFKLVNFDPQSPIDYPKSPSVTQMSIFIHSQLCMNSWRYLKNTWVHDYRHVYVSGYCGSL